MEQERDIPIVARYLFIFSEQLPLPRKQPAPLEIADAFAAMFNGLTSHHAALFIFHFAVEFFGNTAGGIDH